LSANRYAIVVFWSEEDAAPGDAERQGAQAKQLHRPFVKQRIDFAHKMYSFSNRFSVGHPG